MSESCGLQLRQGANAPTRDANVAELEPEPEKGSFASRIDALIDDAVRQDEEAAAAASAAAPITAPSGPEKEWVVQPKLGDKLKIVLKRLPLPKLQRSASKTDEDSAASGEEPWQERPMDLSAPYTRFCATGQERPPPELPPPQLADNCQPPLHSSPFQEAPLPARRRERGKPSAHASPPRLSIKSLLARKTPCRRAPLAWTSKSPASRNHLAKLQQMVNHLPCTVMPLPSKYSQVWPCSSRKQKNIAPKLPAGPPMLPPVNLPAEAWELMQRFEREYERQQHAEAPARQAGATDDQTAVAQECNTAGDEMSLVKDFAEMDTNIRRHSSRRKQRHPAKYDSSDGDLTSEFHIPGTRRSNYSRAAIATANPSSTSSDDIPTGCHGGADKTVHQGADGGADAAQDEGRSASPAMELAAGTPLDNWEQLYESDSDDYYADSEYVSPSAPNASANCASRSPHLSSSLDVPKCVGTEISAHRLPP